MMTLDADVLESRITARPSPRPSSPPPPSPPSTPSRAALAYLKQSGCAAISIVDVDGHCKIKIGVKPNALAVYWSDAVKARQIVRKTRKHAGADPDRATMAKALHHVARLERVGITPDAVAINRAEAASQQLDEYLERLRKCGAMRDFTRMFKRARFAAGLRGEGFMNWHTAELRLRRALIPVLASGTVKAAGLFAEVLGLT